MENIQKHTKFDNNLSITNTRDEKQKGIEMINKLNKNENVNNDNDNDNLSEFSQYRDHDFESDDDLESSLDSTLEFIFDFDIIYKPKNNIEMLENIEIKNKIVNRIKLNALDLQNIKKLDDNEKFELIKIFNHMM
jgi:hypothetical protein